LGGWSDEEVRVGEGRGVRGREEASEREQGLGGMERESARRRGGG